MNDSYPPAIPFHRACYQILKEVVTPEECNLEILFETLKSLMPQKYGTHLLIDYGAIAELQEDYWQVRRGTEEYVLHPVSIPWLQEFYTQLPLRGRNQSISAREISDADPFKPVPPEIMLLIMSDLDIAAIQRFRMASRKAALVDLNRFWKRRLFRDMPWLFDFPVDSRSENSHTIDWQKVYRALYLASVSSYKGKIHALVNRRRIWSLCEQVSMRYHSRRAKRPINSAAEVLMGVRSTKLALLIYPEPHYTTATNFSLVESYVEMQHGRGGILLVHWTQSGELAGLEITREFPTEPSSLRDDIQTPPYDWITGFIITSAEATRASKSEEVTRSVCGMQVLFLKRDCLNLRKIDGDQRLLSVKLNHFLVGLNVRTSRDGLVAKLALLQQPLSRLGTQARYRFDSYRYNPTPSYGQVAEYL
jgi:hypothetical protein